MQAYSDGGQPASVPLKAVLVDMPARASTCQPCDLLPSAFAACIADPSHVFPNGPPEQSSATTAARTSDDYLDITARGLQCGKLRLRRVVAASADIFARVKASGKQRELWNGHDISLAAQRPPKPRRLASPSALLDLITEPGMPIFYSKRDLACCFDTLEAPKALQPFFGRPPVVAHDFATRAGLALDDLHQYIDGDGPDDLTGSTVLFPVSTCWPQGFAWSSCVAQETSLHICAQAGIVEDRILSVDHIVPEDLSEAAAVCTDDILLFDADLHIGQRRAAALDEKFGEAGLVVNHAKDVDQALEMTGLGCEFSNSPAKIEPDSLRTARSLAAALALSTDICATRDAVHSLLGVMQWSCLLQRGVYSCFDACYGFVDHEQRDVAVEVPPDVASELLAAAFLQPLLVADFERQWLPEVTACDASGSYGFGVSYAHLPVDQVAAFGRYAHKRGDYIRLFPDEGDPVEKARLGVPRRLPISHRHFRHAISARAQWKAHSSVLEAHGLALAVRWRARQHKAHHKRLLLLVDAQAIIGCAVKGRTSAKAVRAPLRTFAATCMAADILARILYIPSESNPADEPSRGIKRRRSELGGQRVRTSKSRLGTPSDRRHATMANRAQYLWSA